MKTFFDYVITNYIEEQSPKGDLARDMKKAVDYFAENNVPLYAIESVLEECWNEYMKSDE